eukprot:13946703-Ditylum_brightwellii.AAC.1
MEPSCFTPCSKHFVIKYHWFCRKLNPRNIKLLKIDTALNRGNILTKGLPAKAFKIEYKNFTRYPLGNLNKLLSSQSWKEEVALLVLR